MKKAIHVMGPPGSGKGTQADLIAESYGLTHFDIGRHFKNLIKDKDPLMTPDLIEQFDGGILINPHKFLGLVKKRIEKLAEEGNGIVFSGQPRTLTEAFGDEKLRGFMDFLGGIYNKENILIFKLDISEEVTIDRNSHRLACSSCKKDSISRDAKACSFCGGKLYRRKDDEPEIIKIRLKEYRERTEPIFERLKQEGFKVIEIDGTPAPKDVFKNIKEHLQ